MQVDAYVAIGSNQKSPIQQVKAAICALDKIPKTKLEIVSALYESIPYNNLQQDNYINAVAKVSTALSPDKLLDYLFKIEDKQGRVRTYHHAPRTLDLDLLLFGDCIIHTEKLTLPKKDMENRSFVLYPLYEIAPDLILPDGTELKKLLPNVNNDLIKLQETKNESYA